LHVILDPAAAGNGAGTMSHVRQTAGSWAVWFPAKGIELQPRPGCIRDVPTPVEPHGHGRHCAL